MFDYFHSVLRPVNESKLLVGMMMIFLNVGSKYIDLGLSKAQEQALREGLAREMLIFAISFMGTRDIPTAIILTASFTILSNMLLNENSKYCTNGDGTISLEEEKNAIEILEKAKKQRLKEVQGTFMSYMNVHQQE